MISAEIFESTKPPQSEERTVLAVRNIDTLDVGTGNEDEKVSSVSSEVVKSAYTSTVEPGSEKVTHLSESSLITLINIESKSQLHIKRVIGYHLKVTPNALGITLHKSIQRTPKKKQRFCLKFG